MTATKIYKEEKIPQRIRLAIRTSYIIGNQYLPAGGAEVKRMKGETHNQIRKRVKSMMEINGYYMRIGHLPEGLLG